MYTHVYKYKKKICTNICICTYTYSYEYSHIHLHVCVFTYTHTYKYTHLDSTSTDEQQGSNNRLILHRIQTTRRVTQLSAYFQDRQRAQRDLHLKTVCKFPKVSSRVVLHMGWLWLVGSIKL